ncbi:hypothetical protein PIB30_084837, partial [Stylosanthes scabra]|nr:hypothetical protein [Stylosanthes scabra]
FETLKICEYAPTGSSQYFANLPIETPPQSLLLVADPGSDLVWVKCFACNNCQVKLKHLSTHTRTCKAATTPRSTPVVRTHTPTWTGPPQAASPYLFFVPPRLPLCRPVSASSPHLSSTPLPLPPAPLSTTITI